MIIALIAQDGTKDDLHTLVDKNIVFFNKHSFVATKGTATMLNEFGFDIVKTVRRGIDGGDIQIAEMVLAGNIDFVIFLTNVKEISPHWYDAHALVRVCIAEDLPFAMNVATAERLIKGEL